MSIVSRLRAGGLPAGGLSWAGMAPGARRAAPGGRARA